MRLRAATRGEACPAPGYGATILPVGAGPSAQRRVLSANALVGALAETLGGKGGGNAAFAQGRGGPAADLRSVLEGALAAAAR